MIPPHFGRIRATIGERRRETFIYTREKRREGERPYTKDGSHAREYEVNNIFFANLLLDEEG